MKATCTAAYITELAKEETAVDNSNISFKTSEEITSESTHQKDIQESTVSQVIACPNHTSDKAIISVQYSTETPSVHEFPIAGERRDRESGRAASTEFGPCSKEDFSSEGFLLAAQQQKLKTARKDREGAVTSEHEEERLKVEERLIVEQQLRLEEEERLQELQRKQLIDKQQQQRLHEDHLLKVKEERRQQQIVEKQKKEEERQRKEIIRQQELERSRKRSKEADLRAQQARVGQIRLQKEEKARLERQCQFPDISENQAINMASVNLSQNMHSNSRGPVNRQQSYAYNNVQKRQQTHRSSIASSNGETPIKQRGSRNGQNPTQNPERMHTADNTRTLLLDRLLDGEVQDFREFTKIIEKQNREIVELKNTNIEMEDRLEYQTKERIELEETIEEQEKLWDEKCQQLSKERDDFQKSLQAEQTTNRKLWDLVYAKEKEIQRAYQRRVSLKSSIEILLFHMEFADSIYFAVIQYDGPSQGTRRGSHQRAPERGTRVTDRQTGVNALKSPHDLLEAKGSAQTAQERNAVLLFNGFFGV
jgi:hypothetical protein